MLKGQRPDLTPAQLVGVGLLVLYVLLVVAFGLTGDAKDAIEDLRLVALALIGGDALIRVGRNYAEGQTVAAAVSTGVAGVAIDSPSLPAFIGDPEVEDVPVDDLPSDEEEFAAPPPAAPQEHTP